MERIKLIGIKLVEQFKLVAHKIEQGHKIIMGNKQQIIMGNKQEERKNCKARTFLVSFSFLSFFLKSN